MYILAILINRTPDGLLSLIGVGVGVRQSLVVWNDGNLRIAILTYACHSQLKVVMLICHVVGENALEITG